MDEKNETSFLVPILGALSGLGAIVAAMSPLIFQNRFLPVLFVDEKVIVFSSIVALVSVITMLWLTATNSSYGLFDGFTSVNWQKVKFRGIVLFCVLLVVFYSLKLLYDAKLIGFIVSSVGQMFSYVGAFMSLSLSIGLLFRDSYGSFQRKQIEEKKLDLVRNVLIKAGIVRVDFKTFLMESVPPGNGGSLDLIGAKRIEFETGGKRHVAIISQNYSDLLFCSEENRESK